MKGAWIDAINELNKSIFKSISRRMGHELLYGIDPYPWYIENNALYYENSFAEDNILILKYD